MVSVVSAFQKPRLLPFAEALVHRALAKRGARLHWIETPLGRVRAAEVRGTGTLPPVVVLHGFTSSLAPFARTVLRLSRHATRVVAIDYPGHGRSDVPPAGTSPEALLAAVMGALDVITADSPHALVGNSLGGYVALRYAMKSPERVRGLFLASPAGARLAEEELDTLKQAFDVQSATDVRAFLRRVYFRVPRLVPLFAPAVLAHLKQPFFRDFMRGARIDHMPTPEEVGALQVPITLFWGKDERLLPSSCLDFFKKHLPPSAEILEPANFGHCPHMDDPARFSDHVVRFLERVQT